MIINRYTGEQPTKEEMEEIKREAVRIFKNPYACPELLEWAVQMYPEGFAEIIPEGVIWDAKK